MRKRPRKPVFYTATSMNDGSVLGAFPTRRPSAKHLRDRGQHIDADGVAIEYLGSYVGSITTMTDDQKRRFCDVLSNRLNMRRAVRELVLPELAAIAGRLERLEQLLADLNSRTAG